MIIVKKIKTEFAFSEEYSLQYKLCLDENHYILLECRFDNQNNVSGCSVKTYAESEFKALYYFMKKRTGKITVLSENKFKEEDAESININDILNLPLKNVGLNEYLFEKIKIKLINYFEISLKEDKDILIGFGKVPLKDMWQAYQKKMLYARLNENIEDFQKQEIKNKI